MSDQVRVVVCGGWNAVGLRIARYCVRPNDYWVSVLGIRDICFCAWWCVRCGDVCLKPGLCDIIEVVC